MITIYSNSTTSFLNNGYGALRDFSKSPVIVEVLNGEYYLEFSYQKNGWLSEYLIEQNIIKANGQPFRISNIKSDLKETKVLAKHIAFDLDNNFLEDVFPQNKSGQEAIQWLIDNAEEESLFTAWSDISTPHSARYVRKNLVQALINEDNAIVKTWGGDLEFDNYTIKLHTERGENRGLQIRYGKNLTGIEFKTDFSTLATRIMPIGNNLLLLPEKYIDSPLIGNYFTPIIRTKEYSDIGVDENTTEEQALDLLRARVQKEFDNGIDKPSVSIKVDFIELSKTEEYKNYADLETVRLGDTVNVYISELNLNASVRVVKTTYDCLLERLTKLELGEVAPNIVKAQSKALDTLTKITNPTSLLTAAQQNATTLINSAMGGYIYKTNSELYIMDTDDINTAQKVWRWNLNGLGYSSTGINGDYELAMTIDGSIVADFITTGTMSVERITGLDTINIKANQISLEGYATVNGSFSIDEQGSVNIGNIINGVTYNLLPNSSGLEDFNKWTISQAYHGTGLVYGVEATSDSEVYGESDNYKIYETLDSGSLFRIIARHSKSTGYYSDTEFILSNEIIAEPVTTYNFSAKEVAFPKHEYYEPNPNNFYIQIIESYNDEFSNDLVTTLFNYSELVQDIIPTPFKNISKTFTTSAYTKKLKIKCVSINPASYNYPSSKGAFFYISDILLDKHSTQRDWTFNINDELKGSTQLTNSFLKIFNLDNITEMIKISKGGIYSYNDIKTDGSLSFVDDINGITATELGYLDNVTSNIQTQLNNIWSLIYPVGAIYMSTINTSPGTLFGGTWETITGYYLYAGTGGTVAGSNTSGASSNANSGSTAITVAQMPNHSHDFLYNGSNYSQWPCANSFGPSISFALGTAGDLRVGLASNGSGQGHTHTIAHTHSVTPLRYEVYVWRRTA